MFSIPARVRHSAAVVALILTAAFFRLHHLDRLPPGMHHDEAFNGLDALNLIQGGKLSIFFSENNGREPLHIYLHTIAIALLGSRPWTLRLVAAIAGVLTIPLAYSLTRDLFRHEKAGAPQVALLAAGSLAVSYWHVNFSRIAFRAIFMVPLLTLGLWLFWRGWQQRRYPAFVASGLALGLSLYTYLPARLFPLILAGFVLYLILPGQQPNTAVWSSWFVAARGSALAGLVALLIFVPLGTYFLAHPEDFGRRSQQVSIFTYGVEQGRPVAQILADNLWATARMFVDKGHDNPVLNLPGRPALDGLALLGFLPGLAVALIRLREPHHPLLLLWLVVMLAPTVLSNEPAHPLRAIGILPPLAILTGAGFYRLWALTGRFRRWQTRLLWPVYLLAVLAISGWLTYRDYFQRWPRLPLVADYFDAAEAIIAERIKAQSASYDFYLPGETYRHPTTRFLLASAFDHIPLLDTIAPEKAAILLYPQNRCRLQKEVALFQRTSNDATAVRLLPYTSLNAAALLAPGSASKAILDRQGNPVAREMAGAPGPVLAPALLPRIRGANFDHSLCLLGYDLEPAAPLPGNRVRLILYAEALQPDQSGYEATARLADATGSEIAQFGRQRLSVAPAGPLGEIVASAYEFSLPQQTAPGKYRFEVELFQAGAGDPLPVVDRRDLPVALAVTTDYLTLAAPAPDPQAISQPLAILAGDPPLIKLLGYDLTPATATPGAAIDLDLYWQALQPADRNYTVFIHLFDEAGQIKVQQDIEPMAGRAPTSLWLLGEIIRDRHTLRLGLALEIGIYTLAVGLYDWQTGERLPLYAASGERVPEDRQLLPMPISVVQP